jgi:hypothetical protein
LTINNFVLGNEAHTIFQAKVLDFFNNISIETAQSATPSTIMNDFKDRVVGAATESASLEKKNHPD